MSYLSVLCEDRLFITCANPIFPLSDPDTGTFTFEVFEADSRMLKSRLGKTELYAGLEPGKPPFFGQLVKLEPDESTHSALLFLRDKPTMRAVMTVHKMMPSQTNQ
jgi:hypothetical protein